MSRKFDLPNFIPLSHRSETEPTEYIVTSLDIGSKIASAYENSYRLEQETSVEIKS